MPARALHFLATVLTAMALVPVGAHLLELPNKLALSQADYFTVQGIYRGWWLLGFVLIAAMIASLVLAWHLWQQGGPAKLALAAALLLAATLAIFFAWTFPTNQATENWTAAVDNWQLLRARWEYAHATNAVLTFIAFCALVLSSQMMRR